MSPDTDRIAVPTNGRKPHPASPVTPTEPAAVAKPDDFNDTDDASDAAPSIAFSPKQIAIGFSIVASLILLVAGAARRRSGR
jgi:hypothetical protein